MKRLLLAFAVLSLVIFSGCAQKEKEFKPETVFFLDTYEIQVADRNQTEFITATITRVDDKPVDVVYNVVFPDSKQTVYAADVDGKRLKYLTTKALRGKNSKDTVQFKIWATKGEDDFATKSIAVELWSNGSRIPDQDKTMTVQVV